MYHIVDDCCLNLLDHENCKKVQGFLNLVHQNGMIPTKKKQTRVTRKTATSIDHILTNTFMDRTFKSGLFKSDVSDHYLVIFLILLSKLIKGR